MNLRMLLFVLAISILFSAAFLRYNPSAKPLYGKNSAASPIRLGVFAPTSGEFGTYGVRVARGAQLAKEDLKREGIEIELIEEDVCLPEQSVAALRAGLTLKKLSAIAANFCVIGMNAMVPLLKQNELIAFQVSSLPDELIGQDIPVQSTFPTIAEQARYLARETYSRNIRRVAVLALDTHWGENFARHFTNEFKLYGGVVVYDSRKSIGERDFRTELVRIQASGAEMIFLAHLGEQAGSALRQAKTLNFNLPFLGTDEAADSSVRESAKDGIALLSYVRVVPTVEITTPPVEEKYKSRFGESMPALAQSAYAGTVRTARAISKCTDELTCLRRELAMAADTAEESPKDLKFHHTFEIQSASE